MKEGTKSFCLTCFNSKIYHRLSASTKLKIKEYRKNKGAFLLNEEVFNDSLQS